MELLKHDHTNSGDGKKGKIVIDRLFVEWAKKTAIKKNI